MRVNTIQPNPDGSQYALVPLTVLDDSGSLAWFIDRDDDTVDLAVTPVGLNRDVVDYKTIQSDLFATKVRLLDPLFLCKALSLVFGMSDVLRREDRLK
jgi:hypothetical protein